MSLLILLFSACAAPSVIRSTPQAAQTATRAAVPAGSVTATTPAAPGNATQRVVERVAIATAVGEDGSPTNETATIPQGPEAIFLCVRVRDLPRGTRLRATWFAGDQMIGQSDGVSPDVSGGAAWVALRYRPIGLLNPATVHSVELKVGDDIIDRYVFRVGSGSIRDVLAEAGFATGFDDSGKLTGSQSRFYIDTTQLTLLLRISNQVDPTGIAVTTLWYRGDTQIAQLLPDPLPPAVAGQPEPDRRRRSVTFHPATRLVPGSYSVVVLLNGVEAQTVPFTITSEPLPTPTLAPTPTPEPTATPTPEPTRAPTPTEARPTAVPSSADAVNVVVASQIDPTTNAPLDGPIFVWEAAPGSASTLWVAVDLRSVVPADLIEISVWQDDVLYAGMRLPQVQLAEGWLAARFDVVTPPADVDAYVYTVSVLINGQRALDASFLVQPASGP